MDIAIGITTNDLDDSIRQTVEILNAADPSAPALLFEDVAYDAIETIGKQIRALLAQMPQHAANDQKLISNCVKRQRVRLLREEADERAKVHAAH